MVNLLESLVKLPAKLLTASIAGILPATVIQDTATSGQVQQSEVFMKERMSELKAIPGGSAVIAAVMYLEYRYPEIFMGLSDRITVFLTVAIPVYVWARNYKKAKTGQPSDQAVG